MVTAALRRISGFTRRVDVPVLTQEMRIRQRGTKPFAILFAYVAVLSIIALIVLAMMVPHNVPSYQQSTYPSGQNFARQGRQLFTILSMAQLVMIALIVPAYSSGAVSTERERGTFDLLVLTLLSSNSIVAQKLVAAIAQALMLTVASLPVVAIVFMLGGVSPLEMAIAYGILFLTAGAFGALGLLCSCQFKNTKTATFVTYLTVLGFLVGVPVVGQLMRSLTRMQAMDGAFAPAFVVMFAFLAAAFSLPPFVIAAMLLKRYTDHWRSRTFRMLTFGATYAFVAFALRSPSLIDPLIGVLFGFNGQLFLPSIVNPFVAMSFLMYSDYMYYSGSSWRSAMQYWAVGGTMVFSAAVIYMFKHISTLRFEAMRRK